MGNNFLLQNPFAVLTVIVAPAILTNASTVLAMSTINRFLRTRERMHQMFEDSKTPGACNEQFLGQVARVERQGVLLLSALHWIYISIGAFAAASLVTLLGAGIGPFGPEWLLRVIVGMGLLLGCAGVGGLIGGCVNLFNATQLSLANIREEAELMRRKKM
jgi:hypothetical protein